MVCTRSITSHTKHNRTKQEKKFPPAPNLPIPLPISKPKKINQTHFHTAITKQTKLLCMYKYIQDCTDSAK